MRILGYYCIMKFAVIKLLPNFVADCIANNMITIAKIWLSDDAVWIRTDDGREACELFADYPRLRYATPEQRKNYIADEYGINWPDIDEDLSFET